MDHYKYGIYIDVKSKSGQLLRSGTLYAPTKKRFIVTVNNALWLVGVPSTEVIWITDVVNWHKGISEETIYSDAFCAESNDCFIEYYYVKKI